MADSAARSARAGRARPSVGSTVSSPTATRRDVAGTRAVGVELERAAWTRACRRRARVRAAAAERGRAARGAGAGARALVQRVPERRRRDRRPTSSGATRSRRRPRLRSCRPRSPRSSATSREMSRAGVDDEDAADRDRADFALAELKEYVARERADRLRAIRRPARGRRARRPLIMSNAKEFVRRRRELMGMIGANGIAVLAAAPERVRSRDTLFIYRPDSDFYYLTGFPEPEAVAVLVPGRPQGEFLLFCRERNPERELWDGPRAGPEGAVATYGADDAYPIDGPRRHPARAARAQRPRLLLDRQERVRPEAARVHPDVEREAPEQPRAERPRRARSPAARDAALQEPRRSGHDAPLREDRGRGARARDASSRGPA